jgi:hypothetical protein
VDDRADALAEIVRLARRHELTAGEIAAALVPDVSASGAPAAPGRGVIVRVLGVLGGTFVFAGIGVFIALQWEAMSPPARVIVTLGTGVTAFVLASLARREPRFLRAATPLYLAAAALEPTGMLVAFSEFGSGGDWRVASLITTGTMALQFGATFASVRRSTPLFMTVFFATLFFGTALDLVNADYPMISIVLGASLLLAAVGADRSAHRAITPAWYFFGAALFLFGFYDFVENSPVEILFLGVAAGFVYLSITLHSRMLLFVATLAILASPPVSHSATSPTRSDGRWR